MIAPIFSATGAPPTGHPPTSASPFTIAAARPEQPAYPQPPQLFPGSSARMASSLSSTSTANFLPDTPRKTPINSPVPPTIAAAIKIPDIISYVLLKSIPRIRKTQSPSIRLLPARSEFPERIPEHHCTRFFHGFQPSVRLQSGIRLLLQLR